MIVVLTILSLQACATSGTLTVVSPHPPTIDLAGDANTVTLEAILAITPHRGLLALVTPWAASDIDHVGLELFQDVTSKGTLTVTQAQLGNVVRINNLSRNTAYTIQAHAWQDGAETVPIDNFDISASTCTTSFATTSDDALNLTGGIALRLRDRSFSGLGSGAIAITPGSLLNGGAESLTQNQLGRVTTFAGSALGWVDATGVAAQFNAPHGLALDSHGNLYVAEFWGHRIRKITPQGVVTTLAGSTQGYADGTGAAAQFDRPIGVAVDGSDNVYVADWYNSLIRKITPTGVVTTLAGSTQGYADGTGTSAQFHYPADVVVDAAGNLYVADGGNHRIRKITPTGVVTTLAGSTQGYADGVATVAQFDGPRSLALDPSGNLYVADRSNQRIRVVTAAGVVTTLAGSTQGYADGMGTAAQFMNPTGVALSATGDLFVVDQGNHRIRKVTGAGSVTTLAGSVAGYLDATGTDAKFNLPRSIAVSPSGTVYVSDTENHRIRAIY